MIAHDPKVPMHVQGEEAALDNYTILRNKKQKCSLLKKKKKLPYNLCDIGIPRSYKTICYELLPRKVYE